ncbi:MAG: DUF1566 domain-containing protein [Saprospiraceae bacterium]
MKKLNIIYFLFAFQCCGLAQVGIGTLTPASTAALDVTSTSQGFLPPRMTKAQRIAISSPAMGLMIYCTDCGAGELEIYSGVYWRNMIGGALAPPLAIGDSYGGGKVAYILLSGDPGYIEGQVHGLIAPTSDQSLFIEWGCIGANMPGAEGTSLGTGNQNTIDIVTGCVTTAIAARICDDLVLGGYSDWFLPSKDELNKLYLNRVAIGGFSTASQAYYWSSSESTNNVAWYQNFCCGNQNTTNKNLQSFVRAVRAF